MRILILHKACHEKRKTIDDHLYSFQRYATDTEFYYWDFRFTLPPFLSWIKWDGIIIHYTLLAERSQPSVVWDCLFKGLGALKEFSGYKVVLPQDEYVHSIRLCELIQHLNVGTVFTCAMPIDYETLYPLKKTGLKHRITTFTGFVDEETFTLIKQLSQETPVRSIDIGYRARNLPFSLGRHGLIKHAISEAAKKTPNQQNLALNISTDAKDVFFGNDWIRFLLSCRSMLGCLGGSSIHDPDGTIYEAVTAHLLQHPNASFEEVEASCFPNQEGSLSLFALSPRHFECAMAKCCQLLVEGDYQGVFLPGVHYIEIKKDFSNLPEVFENVANQAHCQQLAENTYRDVVQSNKYTYSAFAHHVVSHIRENAPSPSSSTSAWKTLLVRKLIKINSIYSFFDYWSYRIQRKLGNLWKQIKA